MKLSNFAAFCIVFSMMSFSSSPSVASGTTCGGEYCTVTGKVAGVSFNTDGVAVIVISDADLNESAKYFTERTPDDVKCIPEAVLRVENEIDRAMLAMAISAKVASDSADVVVQACTSGTDQLPVFSIKLGN